jgi:N-carbamoyl-L-amino-acid hydrolase
MRLRHDAGFCAAAIGTFLRDLARDMGGSQVCTMGKVDLHPNLINVIAARAKATVDLRNTDEALLQEAERRVAAFLDDLARAEGVRIETRRLARFAPVVFDAGVASLVERTAARLGHSCRRITSGAGHDAQMLARICPAGMIFVPSVKGISHNPAEHTAPADLAAGANVLLHSLLELAA